MDKKKFEKVLKEFLKYFDEDVKLEIIEGEKEGDSWEVKIDAENSGLLIGKFGDTLNAFQHIIRLMAAKLAGGRFLVAVDIGNYKSSKNKEIEELSLLVAENVKNSGYGQTLRPMNAYERRIVHVVLKDFPDIEAISTGEEPYRCVEIKPKGK